MTAIIELLIQNWWLFAFYPIYVIADKKIFLDWLNKGKFEVNQTNAYQYYAVRCGVELTAFAIGMIYVLR